MSITVADNGPGISVEPADQIFDPYVSTKDTGLGLGCHLPPHRHAHGGRITADQWLRRGNNLHGPASRQSKVGEVIESLLIIDDEPNVC